MCKNFKRFSEELECLGNQMLGNSKEGKGEIKSMCRRRNRDTFI
jgi:hypothetical protein